MTATGDRSRSMQRVRFSSLPGTAVEAEALKRIYTLPPKHVLIGEAASEAALLSLQSPGRLHIATHGFFLGTDESIAAFDEELALSLSNPLQYSNTRAALAKWENPLLRSGLVLTGANRTLAGENIDDNYDGIVTAYELSGMNLQGTDLVVLSACETGVGEIQNGEGVFGLRRSFQLAGAETVVMSLWQVADNSTAKLMVDFYEGLDEGKNKVQALRSAALALRSQPGYEHPYYWGAFILSGNPN